MIAHPLLLWIEDSFVPGSSAKPLLILSIYLFLTFIAVVVNRRVFIFSGLVYLVKAVLDFGNSGANDELVIAFATLPIGLGMLALSSYWSKARNLAISHLPTALTAQLPRTELKVPLSRPVG